MLVFLFVDIVEIRIYYELIVCGLKDTTIIITLRKLFVQFLMLYSPFQNTENNIILNCTHHNSLAVPSEVVFEQPREHGVSIRHEFIFVLCTGRLVG